MVVVMSCLSCAVFKAAQEYENIYVTPFLLNACLVQNYKYTF